MASLSLLALDGGGVRGLVSLLILRRLMHLISPKDPPKPCHVFDVIAGTSTGGLIAIMLGRLEMDIDACISAYINLSKVVFTLRKRTKVFGRILPGLMAQAAFDHSLLEQELKRVIVQAQENEDALLLQDNPKCKVFVCASMSNADTRRLRNYASTQEESVRCKIWEAARATSAAPTIFDPITFENGVTFRDGALRDNNPIFELADEVQLEFPDTPVSVVVSIGTGVPASIVMSNSLTSLAKVCGRLATDAEKIARRFEAVYCSSSGPFEEKYFRFNVSRGVEAIHLEEWHKADLMMSSTQSYLREEHVRLRECAIRLSRNKIIQGSPFQHDDQKEHTARSPHRSRARNTPVVVQSTLPNAEQSSSQRTNLTETDHTSKSAYSYGHLSNSPQNAIMDTSPVNTDNQLSSNVIVLAKSRSAPGTSSFHGSFYQLDRIGKQPVPYFVMRDELLKMELKFDNPSDSGRAAITCLLGLGGSGKTQLMLQYAWRKREEYGVVLWFDASSVESLTESFKLAASQLGLRLSSFENVESSKTALERYKSSLQTDRDAIFRELQRRGQRWLFLFDQADDLAVVDTLPTFMPSDSNGHILVSSRRKQASRLGHYSLQITGLPPNGARDLLLHHADKINPSAEELQDAARIVESLDYIALAVDLAGTYIQSLDNLKEYIALYESSKREELLMRSLGGAPPIASGYKLSVFAAWRVSIAAIPKDVARFLYLLCFLDPTNLTKDMFKRACSKKYHWSDRGMLTLLEPTTNGVPMWLLKLFCDDDGQWNSLKFDETVQQLATYFLVHKEFYTGVWLHSSGPVDVSNLTSDGSSITLLKLPQPVHDLGKYYPKNEERLDFCYTAFSVVVHSFANEPPVNSDTASIRRTAMQVGWGGIVLSPSDLQRQLEAAFAHVLIFKDFIKEIRSSARCFDGSLTRWRSCELILFASIFWPELLSRQRLLLESYGLTPWEMILQITNDISPRESRPGAWSPRLSGYWEGAGFRSQSGQLLDPFGSLYDNTHVQDRKTEGPTSLESGFEWEWAFRNSRYHEHLANSNLSRKGGLQGAEKAFPRFAAKAVTKLIDRRQFGSCTCASVQSINMLREWATTEANENWQKGETFHEWLESPQGVDFLSKCDKCHRN